MSWPQAKVWIKNSSSIPRWMQGRMADLVKIQYYKGNLAVKVRVRLDEQEILLDANDVVEKKK